MKKENHIEYLDIAKGIFIILIVVGHSNGPLRNFLYLFHVAAFFFISGVFYKDAYVKAPLQMIYKRIKTLYIPYLLYSALFIALHDTFVRYQIYTQKYGYSTERSHLYNMQDYIFAARNILTMGQTEQLLDPLWFITCLFIVQILMLGIDLILTKLQIKPKETVRLFTVTAFFIAGMVLSLLNIRWPLFIHVAFVALGVFYAGYIYKRFEDRIPLLWQGAVVSCSLLVLNSYFGGTEMAGNTYPDPAFFIVNSAAGIYMVLWLSKYLENYNNIAVRFIKYASANSYHILALHFLAFKVASLIIIPIKHYPADYIGWFPVIHAKASWWILYSVVGVVVPLLIVYTVQTAYRFIMETYENSHLSKGHE